MNSKFLPSRFSQLVFGLFAICLTVAPMARAGLTIDVHLYHDNFGYYFYPYLSANTNLPGFPDGVYQIASPQIPTNGSRLIYLASNNTISECYNGDCGGGSYYGTYNDMINGITNVTNGLWSIAVTNNTSTNLYYFAVQVTGLTSNIFGAPPQAVFPTDGEMNVTSQPLMQWTGPANWGTLLVQDAFIDTNGNYYVEDFESLPPNTTSWTPGVVLPIGTNQFTVTYQSNVTALVTANQPTNSSGQPISGWVSTATLEAHFAYGNSYDVSFTVGTPIVGNSNGGHTNIAHYTFDNSGNLGQDSSGNGNDLNGASWWGPQQVFSASAEAGGGAVQFFGTSSLTPNGQSLTNLNAVLAGSFTFSAWVNTTNSTGDGTADAVSGAAIFWAYNDQNNTNDTIPLAITGSKVAFSTRDHLGTTTTIHSLTSVNDGNYHLITVTRNQADGEMDMYVDGNLEASTTGTTDPLNGNNYYLSVGGTTISSYTGLLDDLQVYSGVLSNNEVLQLYNGPGTTIPNVAAGSENGIVAHYDFDENAVVAPDVSGNGNDMIYAGNFGGSGPTISSDTAAGAGSVSFDGGSYLTASSNLLSTLAGDFTVSLWLKTSQSYGSQGDLAWQGAGIISADSPNGGAKDLIPVALTGGQVAFNIGDGVSDNTLNSSAMVNDGVWHYVVVTRNQSTGARQIFIDGVLDSSDIASTVLLNSPVLLTLGCKADASNPDPSSPTGTGANGYNGLLDDVQIYNRVLSANEVSFLYNNPGATVAGSTTNTPYPVDVNLQFSIIRTQDQNLGEIYGGSVSFNSVNPAPSTTNSVHSPHNYFNTETYPGGGGGSGAILSSLNQVISEFTNGSWTININQGSPTQEVYTFQVAVSGLDTNLLKAVKVFTPTNNAILLSATPPYYWTGPSNFSTLQVDLLSGPIAALPVTATNWPSPPSAGYGTNRFDVGYNSNNFGGVTFTTPMDGSSNLINSWAATANLISQALIPFVVANPVVLTNTARVSGNFQFSFQTVATHTNIVLSRTNLVVGTWVPVTNFIGDGTVKQFAFPTTNPPIRFFRVETQ